MMMTCVLLFPILSKRQRLVSIKVMVWIVLFFDKSCHSLKNYEAIYIILDGLTAEYLRGFTQGAWQVRNSMFSLKCNYYLDLKGIA